MTSEELSKTIQKAAIDNNLSGVMALVDHCGLTYPKVVRAWKGDRSITIVDLSTICESLGLDIKVIAKA